MYLHILGAFAFVFAHGASALAAFRIRATRDPAQIRTLLDVSSLALGVMYVGLLLLLVGGVAAGIVGDHFGRGWIWAALVLLVVIIVAMYAMATPFYGQLRVAAGASAKDPKVDPTRLSTRPRSMRWQAATARRCCSRSARSGSW